MENPALYRRLLLKFGDSQASFADAFSAAQQDADPAAATRAAHTLKGMAGNIGALGVQQAAQALETACGEGASAAQQQALLVAVLEQLATVIASLRALDSPLTVADTPAVVAPDASTVRGHAERLRALLAESDSAAAELWEEHLQLFKAGLPRHWRRIAAGLSDLDLDAALAALDEAMTEGETT